MSQSFQSLILFATSLLCRAGLESEKARTVAEVLVEADLLGHTTHGLALMPSYLTAIENGIMAKTGQPECVMDTPSAVLWDGHCLPGAWLTTRAIEIATERARQHAIGMVVIRRAHHIGCLAAYLESVARKDLFAILYSSGPGAQVVAPHGSCEGIYTPNPIAAAWPTNGEPVILDVSMSITTASMMERSRQQNRSLCGEWAMDATGNPTKNPHVLQDQPPGALLPIGGLDHGHKGYALGLLVETLTSALCGYGRTRHLDASIANVHIQIMDPKQFGGMAAFLHETSWLAQACQMAKPRKKGDIVRLPGESGLRKKAQQLARGIKISPEMESALQQWADKLGVKYPDEFPD